MNARTLWCVVLVLWVVAGGWQEESEARRRSRSTVYLNESRTNVYWNDGDSFRVVGYSRRGVRARIAGFNTLENHGPVHRWGTWKAHELLGIAWKATEVARRGVWNCQKVGKRDAYKRILVSCPDLARALISKGLAHVYSVRGRGDATLLRIQQTAQRQRRGMWAKGVPSHIVTSLHSAAERQRNPYNRLISTRSGATLKHRHSRYYRTCQWICLKGSCMLYVPYKKRYGYRRASCLRRSTTTDTDP
ncbi:MAG: nuclease [Deltaproteobacteria bacterium]|nr:MAG: nuclease [Deltaproteobacteria bacterium]